MGSVTGRSNARTTSGLWGNWLKLFCTGESFMGGTCLRHGSLTVPPPGVVVADLPCSVRRLMG